MTQNSNLRLPAVPDPTAPYGWRAESGAYYRPDWGDQLVQEGESYYIEIKQILGEVNALVQPPQPPTLQQFQAEWGLA